MNIEVGSFIWAFLQIAGLCTVALAIACGLRGRHPQFITAMLAGTCLATLALAAVAIVPALQWTFVDDSREVATVNGFSCFCTSGSQTARPSNCRCSVAGHAAELAEGFSLWLRCSSRGLGIASPKRRFAVRPARVAFTCS